jgi:hypothetical protein
MNPFSAIDFVSTIRSQKDPAKPMEGVVVVQTITMKHPQDGKLWDSMGAQVLILML